MKSGADAIAKMSLASIGQPPILNQNATVEGITMAYIDHHIADSHTFASFDLPCDA